MRAIVSLVLLLFVLNANALDRCSPNFTTIEEKKSYLDSLLESKTKSKQPNAKLYSKYKSLKASAPNLVDRMDESVLYDVMIDEEMAATAKSLDEFLDKLSESVAEKPSTQPLRRLKDTLRKHLEGKVPEASIEARIEGFISGEDVFRGLGEKSFDEVAEMFHGGNPLEPTSNSILGKFISKHRAATVRRSFSHGPGYSTFGQEKLVVAVDQSMMKEFAEIMSDPHLFAHYHTPGQGTLNVLHEDQILHWYGTYGTKFSDYTAESGTIIPTVFLSSTESQRMTQYMKGLKNNNIREQVKAPWNLEGYCAKGGYSSCTHWVGNIPIGDEKVASYTFPGKVDDYAYNSIHDDPELDKLPRTQDLVPYKFPKGLKKPDKDLLQRIWKVPGNQQLSYLLGIGKANEYGQMANPGWVAHIFTSRIKVNRSPVVFVFVDDAKQALSADFDLHISAH